jgi:hypothetical protein
MMLLGELRSEVVECMRGVSGAGEEDKRSAGAAPVEYLKPDARLNRDKLHCVRRMVRLTVGQNWVCG